MRTKGGVLYSEQEKHRPTAMQIAKSQLNGFLCNAMRVILPQESGFVKPRWACWS